MVFRMLSRLAIRSTCLSRSMAMTPKYQVVMKVNQKSGVKSAQQQVDDWQNAARTKGKSKLLTFFLQMIMVSVQVDQCLHIWASTSGPSQ